MDQQFELKDPEEKDEKGEEKPDEEKTIVIKEVAPVQEIGTVTLAELRKALERWQDLQRQAEENIPKLEAQIKDAEKLFSKK